MGKYWIGPRLAGFEAMEEMFEMQWGNNRMGCLAWVEVDRDEPPHSDCRMFLEQTMWNWENERLLDENRKPEGQVEEVQSTK